MIYEVLIFILFLPETLMIYKVKNSLHSERILTPLNCVMLQPYTTITTIYTIILMNLHFVTHKWKYNSKMSVNLLKKKNVNITCTEELRLFTFLPILSSSVRLDRDHSQVISRSLHRCSIRFKSGLCLGHSRTFAEMSLSHSFVV